MGKEAIKNASQLAAERGGRYLTREEEEAYGGVLMLGIRLGLPYERAQKMALNSLRRAVLPTKVEQISK